MAKKTYSVRVRRTYYQDTADLEVEASSPEEAKEKALQTAKEYADDIFGYPEEEIDIDESLDIVVVD